MCLPDFNALKEQMKTEKDREVIVMWEKATAKAGDQHLLQRLVSAQGKSLACLGCIYAFTSEALECKRFDASSSWETCSIWAGANNPLQKHEHIEPTIIVCSMCSCFCEGLLGLSFFSLQIWPLSTHKRLFIEFKAKCPSKGAGHSRVPFDFATFTRKYVAAQGVRNMVEDDWFTEEEFIGWYP